MGTVIGSFLNVCILRIPEKMNIVTERSHCLSCNTKLQWYEMIPVFSYIFLLGRCRTCKERISIQYPIVEALNGILYVLVFCLSGWKNMAAILLNVIYCLVLSALIVLSFIDIRTNIIPAGVNIFIIIMGLCAASLGYFRSGRSTGVILDHAIGFVAVSGFLLLVYYLFGGRAIGGGDIKLMAGAGLLLGWGCALLAFLAGCVLAGIIHPIRMRVKKLGRVLAFGPYLSVGIAISMLFGDNIIDWYIQTFFV
jgi:leader peptidase (prepilin peptidase)/N-methyltransferase